MHAKVFLEGCIATRLPRESWTGLDIIQLLECCLCFSVIDSIYTWNIGFIETNMFNGNDEKLF
jgi:hypothetical protein